MNRNCEHRNGPQIVERGANVYVHCHFPGRQEAVLWHGNGKRRMHLNECARERRSQPYADCAHHEVTAPHAAVRAFEHFGQGDVMVISAEKQAMLAMGGAFESAALAAGCGGLEVLSLRGCGGVGDAAVRALCGVRGSEREPAGLPAAGLDALREVDLVGTAVDSQRACGNLACAFMHSIQDMYTPGHVVTGGPRPILKLLASGADDDVKRKHARHTSV